MPEGQISPENEEFKTVISPLFAAVLAFPYYLFLITNGTFDVFRVIERPLVSGMVFNSMLSHMLHGDFSVDASAIKFEAFVRNGKTFAYFGIAPTMLRVPLLLVGKLATADITALSIAVAGSVSAYWMLSSANLIRRLACAGSLQTLTYAVFVLSVLFAGPEIEFLKASIYQEVICWAMALNSAFIYCAIKGLFPEITFSLLLRISMATIAGLALLTRVTTGLGLYIATSLLLLLLAMREAYSERRRRTGADSEAATRIRVFFTALLSPGTLIPMAILIGCAVISCTVNYERWGNPLTFMDLRLWTLRTPKILAIINHYGEFNVHRIWFGAAYYFFPINFVVGQNHQFLFDAFRRSYYDGVEIPPSSFFISDPLLIVLGLIFLLYVMRKRQSASTYLVYVGALTTGFAVPAFLMLIFFFAAFRYRGDFYALFEFTALLGLYVIGQPDYSLSKNINKKLKMILSCSAVVGILASHMLLVAYKVTPFGPAEVFMKTGWLRGYYWSVDKWLYDRKDVW